MGKSARNFDTDAKGFIAGFYTWARSERDILIATTLGNAVLLFPDETPPPMRRSTLSSDLSRDDKNESVKIEQNPHARAFWKPGEQAHDFISASREVRYLTSITDNARSRSRPPTYRH